jgi:hypothetical protein
MDFKTTLQALLDLGFELVNHDSFGSARLIHRRCPGWKGNLRDGSVYLEKKSTGITATGRHRAWLLGLTPRPGDLGALGREPRWLGEKKTAVLRSLRTDLGRS